MTYENSAGVLGTEGRGMARFEWNKAETKDQVIRMTSTMAVGKLSTPRPGRLLLHQIPRRLKTFTDKL